MSDIVLLFNSHHDQSEGRLFEGLFEHKFILIAVYKLNSAMYINLHLKMSASYFTVGAINITEERKVLTNSTKNYLHDIYNLFIK